MSTGTGDSNHDHHRHRGRRRRQRAPAEDGSGSDSPDELDEAMNQISQEIADEISQDIANQISQDIADEIQRENLMEAVAPGSTRRAVPGPARDDSDGTDSDDSDTSDSSDMNDGDGGDDDAAVPEPLADIGSDVDDDHTFSVTCITSGVNGETTATVKGKLSRDMKGMAVSTERIVRLCPFGPDPRMVLCNLKMLRRLFLHCSLYASSSSVIVCLAQSTATSSASSRTSHRCPACGRCCVCFALSLPQTLMQFYLTHVASGKQCPTIGFPSSPRASGVSLPSTSSTVCCAALFFFRLQPIFTHLFVTTVGSNDLCDIPEWFSTMDQLQLLYCLQRILFHSLTWAFVPRIMLVRAQWTTTRLNPSRTRF